LSSFFTGDVFNNVLNVFEKITRKFKSPRIIKQILIHIDIFYMD